MRLSHYALTVGAALVMALSVKAQDTAVGGQCDVDIDCVTGCCGSQANPSVCLVKTVLGVGDDCATLDGCDCGVGRCVNDTCPADPLDGLANGQDCTEDIDCATGCCASQRDPQAQCVDKGTIWPGQPCETEDGCDCWYGKCIDGFCPGCWDILNDFIRVLCPDGMGCCPNGTCVPDVADCDCPPGTSVCGDPHMKGLRGQAIDWSGIDGGWYCLVTDDNSNLHVNVRVTAPLPEDFPDRQLITGISVLSGGHSLTIEVSNPYDVSTNGCPSGIAPCLANGGLRVIVDGEEINGLLRSSRNEHVADGLVVSATNLPVECRQFGGDKIWARMYDEMLQAKRQLTVEESFEHWILRFDHMAAPDWCAQYIDQHNLADLQSDHAIFKIVAADITVRLNVGTNFQGNGELDWDGRVLPDLEFWQMDMGLLGLSVESETLSGILGETARPVQDNDGNDVMTGYGALRGTVEDYRVSGSLGTDFALLNNK